MAKAMIFTVALTAMCVSAHIINKDSETIIIGQDMPLFCFGDPLANYGDKHSNVKIRGELAYPAVRTYLLPDWQDFAIEHDQGVAYVTDLEDVADLLADEALISRDDIDIMCKHVTAVCYVETGLQHYNMNSDTVITGDNGLAVGIAQLHPLWADHFGLNRASLRDSLEMCARLLLRGGWKAHDADAQDRAFGYYNTGKRKVYRPYVNKVHEALEMIENEDDE